MARFLRSPGSPWAWVLPALLAFTPGTAGAQHSSLEALRSAAASRDPQAVLRLARALRRAGHFDEAVRSVTPATRGAARTEAVWELARIRFAQGDFRASQAACNQLPAGRNPRDPAGLQRHLCLARANLVWQRPALAERELAPAREVEPNNAELQLVTAEAARMSGRVQDAEAAFRAAASAMPGRADPLLGLGLLQETAQRFDEAEQSYRRGLEADREDPAAALALGRFLLRRRHQATAALPLLQQATTERPEWPEALVLLGDAQLSGNQAQAALTTFEQLARLAPNQPGTQSGLGRARLANNQLAPAEQALRLAVQQVPNDAEAHAALAEVLGRTDRGEESLELWNRAIDLAPTDFEPRMRAAAQARSMAQTTRARGYIDRILADDAQYGPALVLRGDVAMDEGDRNTARQLYNSALGATHGTVDREYVQRRIAELDAPPRTQRRR